MFTYDHTSSKSVSVDKAAVAEARAKSAKVRTDERNSGTLAQMWDEEGAAAAVLPVEQNAPLPAVAAPASAPVDTLADGPDPEKEAERLREGHVDMAFLPHPILPNTLYNDRRTKIPAVANNSHIGDSVWASAHEGGD